MPPCEPLITTAPAASAPTRVMLSAVSTGGSCVAGKPPSSEVSGRSCRGRCSMNNDPSDGSEVSHRHSLDWSRKPLSPQEFAMTDGSAGVPVSHSTRPRVVVVGAGFGGLEAARKLARSPVDVTVIDRHNYHLFQPLLSQVATAALSPARYCPADTRHTASSAERHGTARRGDRHRHGSAPNRDAAGVEMARALAKLAHASLSRDF